MWSVLLPFRWQMGLDPNSHWNGRQQENTELKFDLLPLSVYSWIVKTGRHVDSYDETMAVWFMLLKLVKDQMGTIHGCLWCNVAPVYAQPAFSSWVGSRLSFPRKSSLASDRLVQELPESVNEHFLVELMPQKNHCYGHSDHDPAKGETNLVKSMPNRVAFVLMMKLNSDSVLQLVYDALQKTL